MNLQATANGVLAKLQELHFWGLLRDYVDSYGAISEGAVKRIIGQDVFAETAEEVRAHWNLEHPDMRW